MGLESGESDGGVMSDWMYAHSLPVEDHPEGCTCGGCKWYPLYQPLDVWQFDSRREIMISNSGLPPANADLRLGEAPDWDAAYDIAEPIAQALGYRIIEHDISDDESDDE